MSTADLLLARSHTVRRLRPRKGFAASWQISCTGHEDKHPSLDVDETVDGRVLVCCRAGCNVHEIVVGAGLQLADLFPQRPQNFDDRNRAPRQKVSADSTLRVLDDEIQRCVTLILTAGSDDLDPDQRTALAVRAGRIRAARWAWEAGR